MGKKLIAGIMALSVVVLLGLTGPAPAYANGGNKGSIAKVGGDVECHSACLDWCAWYQQFYSKTGPLNDTTYPTESCVLQLMCNGGGCNVLHDEEQFPIEKIASAARRGDSKYLSQVLQRDKGTKLNVKRQSIQVAGCGNSVSANIPLDTRTVAALTGSSSVTLVH